MADREAVKKAILNAAGNPSSGVIADYADRFADAVIALDITKPIVKRDVDSRETRLSEGKEKR